MNKGVIKVTLFLIIFAIIGTGIGYGFASADNVLTHDRYKGKELLNEAEYLEFKDYLALEETEVLELQSLSSSEHLVNFEVYIEKGTAFPFGNKKANPYVMYILMGSLIGLASTCTLSLFFPCIRIFK